MQRFLERAPDGHHLADGLHLGAERAIRAGELLELPFRDFHHHVVNSRFETGGSLLGNVVRDFVEAHARGKARGNFRNREAGGFAGQRGAARHARVHLDNDHAAVLRIDGELHVRAAGLDANFADDGGRGVAHALIFLIRQRLRGSDSDGIASVHAHGIKILNGADDHEVVAKIAHDFEFEFFPAEDGFLDQRLVNRAHVERGRNGFGKFLLVVSNRPASAAKRERWADHEGKTKLIAEPHGIFRVIHQSGGGHFQPDFAARIFEPQAVFGNLDRAERGANHFHFVFFEDAAFGKLDRKIQCGLPSDRGQQRMRLFLGNDFFKIFAGERFDVGSLCQLGIGHDGRGIGVNQNDFVALRAQRLARLRAGIIEFAGLADDDRARADNQNFFDVFPFRHGSCQALSFA